MRSVYAIARLTLLEALRSRLLLTLAIFAAGVLIFSRFTQFLSPAEQHKIFQDICLGMLSLFTCLLAIVLPVEQIQKERERNGLAALLVKPVSRYGFLAGKLLGFVTVLLLVAGISSALVVLLLQSQGVAWNPDLPKAFAMIFCQGIILIACAILLGVVLSSHFLAMLCGVCLYLAGHMLEPARDWLAHATGWVTQLGALLLLYLLPHLENLNIQDRVVLGDPVAWAYVGENIVYSLTYAAIVFAIASITFNQKDF